MGEITGIVCARQHALGDLCDFLSNDGEDQQSLIAAVQSPRILQYIARAASEVKRLAMLGASAAFVATGESASRGTQSRFRRVCVALKGRIANLRALRKHMAASGLARADDEPDAIVAELVEFYLSKGRAPADAVRGALDRIEGVVAFLVVFADHDDLVIAATKGAAIYVGIDGAHSFATSDGRATHNHDVLTLQSGDIAILGKNSVVVIDPDEMRMEKRPLRGDPARPVPLQCSARGGAGVVCAGAPDPGAA